MRNDTINMQKINNQFAKGITQVKAANDAFMELSKIIGESIRAFDKCMSIMSKLRPSDDSPSATILTNEGNGEVTYDNKGENQ